MKTPAAVSKAYQKAKAVRLKAHAPYSGFQVGAALVCERAGTAATATGASASIVTGCNVENASYGGTVCAERIALFKAVSEGETSFSDIVIVTDAPEPAYPCAFCLQVMAEFFDPSVRIWLGDLKGVRSRHRFGDLLPHPFGPKQLRDAKKAARKTVGAGRTAKVGARK